MLRYLVPVVVLLVACGDRSTNLEVELTTRRIQQVEIADWRAPAVESGQPEITVRQVFTAQGPCRTLQAALMPRYPGEFLLRVVAEELASCPDDSPHIGYIAVLRGLPEGSHRLRVVHVGADGRTLAEAVLEHPIIVTGEPAPGRTQP
jgi:hypothetical protein